MDSYRHRPNVPGYEIIDELGRGGFASVYRARQISIDRLVALKVISVSAVGSEMEHRFRSECRTIGALSWHPHVVALHDAGITPDGAPYLAMELFPDGSLGDLVKSGRTMTPQDVIRAGIQVADALDAAHTAGILHRDVKPDNVLLGRRGEVRLGDFGIATLTDGTVTTGAAFTGTLLYSAPEVLKGERASVRSDVFSLGSTLYTLVVGRPAFSSGSEEIPAAIMWRVVTEPAPPMPNSVPASLVGAIEQAMSKDPAQRHPTAAAFQQHLQELQLDRPGWHAAPTVGSGETIRIPAPPPLPPGPPGPPAAFAHAGAPGQPGAARAGAGGRRRILYAVVAVVAVLALVGAGFAIADRDDGKEVAGDDSLPEEADKAPASDEHSLSGMRGTSPGARVPDDFAARLQAVDADVDTGRRWSVEAYDAVVVTALAVIQADTDSIEFAEEINAVTRSGEKCTTFEACVSLLQDGEDIDYDGVSGQLDFSGNGEPTRAEYSVLEFGDDSSIDVDRTEIVTAEAPDEADVDQVEVEGTRAGDGVLTIGALIPFTGAAAVLAPPMTAAVHVAVAEINESGGVLGKPVEIVEGDSGDAGDDTAASTVDSMIGDNVDAIIGPITTSVTLTIIDQVVGAGVVLFSPGNTWEMLSDYDDKGLYFRTAPSDILQAKVLAEAIAEDDNLSVGVLHLDWNYTVDFAANLEGFLTDLDIEVETRQYSPDAAPFLSEVQAMAEANPDALVVLGEDESAQVLCEMEKQGIDTSSTRIYGFESNIGDALGERFVECQ